MSTSLCKIDGPNKAALGHTLKYRAALKNSGSDLSEARDVGALTVTLPSGTYANTSNYKAYTCSASAATYSCNDTPSCIEVTDAAATGHGSTSLSMPVRNAATSGAAAVGTEGYFVAEFEVDLNCSIVADNNGNGDDAHPDPAPTVDGVDNDCSDPFLSFANTLEVQINPLTYQTQSGGIDQEATYTASASNLVATNRDDDGDGIINATEGSGDADSDGVPNFRDTDADDNGVDDAADAGRCGFTNQPRRRQQSRFP